MIPSIAQQLQAMKTRMEESILPELPADARFAREQASFIITTLGWLLDTHQHEYRYEVVENVEYRELLVAMLDFQAVRETDGSVLAAARGLLDQPGPAPQEAGIPLTTLREQNRGLKNAALGLYSRWSTQFGTGKNPARHLLQALSSKQGRREVAFFKETGWVQTEDDLGALLGESAGASGPTKEPRP